MRRHLRNLEPYQTEEILLQLIEEMKAAVFPAGTSLVDFKKLLYAIQHHERKPELKSKSGRRKKFADDFLITSATKLKSILYSQTNGRISLLRFVSTFLPILDYPRDIRTALNKKEINLAEARSLARINPKNLGQKFKSKPVEIRKELLTSHLKRKDTQAELEKRIKEKLSTTPKVEAAKVTLQVMILEERHDELLEFTEFDTEHLLWEEIKALVYLAREIDPSLMTDPQTVELLNDLDSIKIKLRKYGKTHKNKSF